MSHLISVLARRSTCYTECEASVTSTRCVKAHYLVYMFTAAALRSGIRHSLARQRQFYYEQRKAKKKPKAPQETLFGGVEVFMHEPFSVFLLCIKEQRWPSTWPNKDLLYRSRYLVIFLDGSCEVWVKSRNLERIHVVSNCSCVVVQHGDLLTGGPALYANINAYYGQMKTWQFF